MSKGFHIEGLMPKGIRERNKLDPGLYQVLPYPLPAQMESFRIWLMCQPLPVPLAVEIPDWQNSQA